MLVDIYLAPLSHHHRLTKIITDKHSFLPLPSLMLQVIDGYHHYTFIISVLSTGQE